MADQNADNTTKAQWWRPVHAGIIAAPAWLIDTAKRIPWHRCRPVLASIIAAAAWLIDAAKRIPWHRCRPVLANGIAGSARLVDRARRFPWQRKHVIAGIAAFVCLLIIAAAVYLRGNDPDVRNMIWQPIELFGGQVNDTPHNLGAGLSKTGHTLVFSRRLPKAKHADLFITSFNGSKWSKPRLLTALNTDADELAPTLSRNGRRIYFHSNRPGGLGGHDIYSSIRVGRTWLRPMNLGEKINSEFDECDPALSADEKEVYFASNRPKEELLPDERKTAWRQTMVELAGTDFDIYAAEDKIIPARKNPLRDDTYRKVIITQLGGSPETEKAVGAALQWLSKSQEANGSWSCDKHGGAGGHDNAATGLAALAYMGWGAKHTKKGPYQKPLAKAIKWLTGRVGKDGSLTGGLSNGMYDHGIALIALAEAYELTKDPALLKPLKRTVAFTVKAQNPSLGGWRYQPGSASCDTSVVGWQVMALHSARRAGISVPDKAFKLAAKWMDSVSTGKHRGLYGYSSPGKGAAVTAEGMFVRQLLGARPNEARQKESAAYTASQAPKPNDKNPNLYLVYYGCLALYQQQGPSWKKWNANVKPLLLNLQINKANAGAWHTGTYKSSTGRVISTALAALSLQVYYRYLPMYDAETSGVAAVKKTSKKEVVKAIKALEPPSDPVPLTARRAEAVCSPANDRSPAFTRYGDFLYFSSDRPGGHGGLDLYRSRVGKDGVREPDNLGLLVNSEADDTDPALASHGFELVFASNRKLNEYEPTLLYRTVAREIEPVGGTSVVVAILSFLNKIKWWLPGLLGGLAGLIALITWFIKVSSDPETSRLAKCMAGSVGAHVLILVILSVWMIGQTLTEEIVETMQISVDADALANEKLALALREEMTPLESTPEIAKIRPDIKPIEIPDLKPTESSPKNMAESKFKVDPADLKANAKEIESRELAKQADPAEQRHNRVKFKQPKIALERRPATRPTKSDAESRKVEVSVQPVRAKSDPAAQPERPADPAKMPITKSAPDAFSPARIKPIDNVRATAKPVEQPADDVAAAPSSVKAPSRVKFKPTSFKLEAPAAKPSSAKPSSEVTVNPAEATSDPSERAQVTGKPTDALTKTAKMANETAAVDAKPIANVRATAKAVEQPADTVAAAPSSVKAPSRVKFKPTSFKLEAPSAKPDTTKATTEVVVNPAGATSDPSERAQTTSKPTDALTKTAKMANETAAADAKPIDNVRATAKAVEQPADDVAAAPSSVKAPSRVKFKPTSFKLEAPTAKPSVTRASTEVVVDPASATSDASERAQVTGKPTDALTKTAKMANETAAADAKPIANVRAAAKPVEQQVDSVGVVPGSVKAPSRMKFKAARFKLEAPTAKRGTARAATEVAVTPAGATGDAGERAQVKSDLADALSAMGKMASVTVPMSNVRTGDPALKTITSTDAGTATEVALAGTPAGPVGRQRHLKFTPAGLALEAPRPRSQLAGSGPGVSVEPSRATGTVSEHTGIERGLSSALKALGTIARADVPSRGVRADNPVIREMNYAEEGPGQESGQPVSVGGRSSRVRFKPSAVGLESPKPRGRADGAGGGTDVSVAPVRAGETGPTHALEAGTGSGALGSMGRMSESGIPNELVSAVRGVEQGQPTDTDVPDLSGPSRLVGREGPRLRVRETIELEGRGDKSLDHMRLRDKGERSTLLPGLGTSKEAEAGVKRALDWFTRNQEADGRWSCKKLGGQDGHDNATTGFAILCYYGWGVKHTEKGGDDEDLREPLGKAVKWLAGRVGKDGDLTGGLPKGMYDQGIATMALAEAYGLTRDETLRAPLERAVGFIIKAQNDGNGGWRYKPGSGSSDTSIVGWQVMALMSARLAGVDVPESAFDGAKKWFNRVATGHNRGRYGYSNKGAKHAMTAEAMFCQQLLGVPPFDPRMQESAEFIATKLPASGKPDYYYWYYGCLSLYQHQGPIWKKWNERMRPLLLESQITDGPDAGSWAPNGVYGKYGGRVVSTAMATLSLEVYYRYLPMYGISDIPAEAKPTAKDSDEK